MFPPPLSRYRIPAVSLFYDSGPAKGPDDKEKGKRKKGGPPPHKQKKEPVENINGFLVAEREGFEPPVPLSTAVFKTAVIDHSTISPRRIVWS